MTLFYFYIPVALTAIIIFGYMRNRQANRTDNMRERFWKKEAGLIDLLQKIKKNESTDDTKH